MSGLRPASGNVRDIGEWRKETQRGVGHESGELDEAQGRTAAIGREVGFPSSNGRVGAAERLSV